MGAWFSIHASLLRPDMRWYFRLIATDGVTQLLRRTTCGRLCAAPD
jgi:hypothetical protein